MLFDTTTQQSSRSHSFYHTENDCGNSPSSPKIEEKTTSESRFTNFPKNMNKIKKGFIPVMLTPFKDNGGVDYYGLADLIEFYLESGATGLFANCLSSEMYELTAEERIKVTKFVVDNVKGAVPVVATGTFGGPIEEQAAFTKKIYDTGIQAAIIITSLLAGEEESDEVFEKNVYKLFKLTDNIPMGFYECPDPYKRVLSPEQLGRIAAVSNRILYYKDTSLSIESVQAKIAAAKGNEFKLYDAYMVHAVESLKAGSAGLTCIQGNYFPELIVWLCNNYNVAGLEAEVGKVQDFLIKNMEVMHHVYPTVSKYFLQKRGLSISTVGRKNPGTFTAEIKHNVDRLFKDYQYLQKELGIKSAV